MLSIRWRRERRRGTRSGCADDDVHTATATATPCADVADADLCIADVVLPANDGHSPRCNRLHVATATRPANAAVAVLLVSNADRADGVDRLLPCVRRNSNTRFVGRDDGLRRLDLGAGGVLGDLRRFPNGRGLVGPRVGSRRGRKVADRVGGARCATRHRRCECADEDDHPRGLSAKHGLKGRNDSLPKRRSVVLCQSLTRHLTTPALDVDIKEGRGQSRHPQRELHEHFKHPPEGPEGPDDQSQERHTKVQCIVDTKLCIPV